MNIESVPKHVAAILMIGCLVHMPSAAANGGKKEISTTNVVDRAACQRNLNIIHGALHQYRNQYGKLPLWLSELFPDFIDDAAILTCPFVANSGNVKRWRAGFIVFPVFGDPGNCTYAYEFCTEPFSWVPGWTQRDYKQRQMEVMGLSVPIVRCLAHRPILNLGYDGTVYPSRDEWEDNFVSSTEHGSLFHNFYLLTNRSRNDLVVKFTDRNYPRMLSLAQHYNSLLLHFAQLDASGKSLPSYPEGLQIISGVPFDIRGLVHLTGKNFPIDFPESVHDIEVQRNCKRIHFLHGTMFSAPTGAKIATYRVHYGDGSSNEVAVVYGRDVDTCWVDNTQTAATGDPKPAWITPREAIGVTGKSLRLHVLTWRNNRPNSAIQSIDFISHMTPSAPFLIAITAD